MQERRAVGRRIVPATGRLRIHRRHVDGSRLTRIWFAQYLSLRYYAVEPVRSPAARSCRVRCPLLTCARRGLRKEGRATATDNVDDLVLFEDVSVIKATAQAILCRIGRRSVWLPRWHISGRLWSRGDRGNLFIRRWVARDRKLIDAQGAVIRSSLLSLLRLPLALHLVPRATAPAGGLPRSGG